MEELRFTGFRVEVRQENNKDAQLASLEKALKILKRKMEKDNVLREVKERRYYTKSSQLDHAIRQKIERRKVLARRRNK